MSRHTRLTADAVRCPDCQRIVTTWATHDCPALMMEADDPDTAWTFDGENTRVYCLNHDDIILYDAVEDSAWLACQDAPHLHNWR